MCRYLIIHSTAAATTLQQRCLKIKQSVDNMFKDNIQRYVGIYHKYMRLSQNMDFLQSRLEQYIYFTSVTMLGTDCDSLGSTVSTDGFPFVCGISRNIVKWRHLDM
jgi:hypothetical protein